MQIDCRKNRKLWTALMRSGKYPQGRNRLQTEKKYCVLGVACLAYEKATGKVFPRRSNGTLRGIALEGDKEVVAKWLGLATSEGAHNTTNSVTTLSMLNDQGMSFSALAAIIESEPEGLFIDERGQ